MEILQSTLEEITENEGKMPLLARARYGKFYSNALSARSFFRTASRESIVAWRLCAPQKKERSGPTLRGDQLIDKGAITGE
jgi:hypothetical protein